MARSMRLPRFPAVAGLLSLILVATSSSCGGSDPLPPPPVRILVDGTTRAVAPGSTFGSVIERFDLRAHNGRLLSVQREVLDPRMDPGHILLNGRRRPPSTPLRQGDSIHVVDGHDRTEGTRRIVVELPKPQVANPERTLSRYRIRRITVEGRRSGETVSVTDDPRGRGETPHAVALTFDDGPWPLHTERVLRVLRRFHVRATFFMVGTQIERYPELVREVERQGHEIGNHTMHHPESPPLADMIDRRVAAEMSDANALLADDHVHSTLFRPPGGSYDDAVVEQARLQSMRTVLWSVDPEDWKASRTRKDIVRSVLKHVQAGSIVLLHDGGGDAEHTIAALPDIIRGIRKRGLRFVTVPAKSRS
jgi:peptidoglycan/xylan/chitin deacetylase (PgdA/CDA1 family)